MSWLWGVIVLPEFDLQLPDILPEEVCLWEAQLQIPPAPGTTACPEHSDGGARG